MPHYNHRRNYTNKTLDRKIRNIENNLMELKYKDHTIATPGFIIPATGSLTNEFNFVSSGDGPSNRQGNVINPTSLQVRLFFLFQSADVTRYMLVWDRQANGAVFSLAGTPDSLLDNTVALSTFVSPRNYNTIDRFKILEDTYIEHTQYVPSTPVSNNRVFERNYKLSRKIKFDALDTTTDITNVVSNCLYVVLLTANGADTLVTASFRMYYRDS